MKTIQKIKTILSTLVLLVFINSCNDLDQVYFGQIQDEDLWNSKTDFDQAINGAVAYLDSPYGFYTRQFFLMEEATTDYFSGDSGSAGEHSSFENFRTSFPTTFSWALWIPLYKSVYQCNLVLDRLYKFPVRINTDATENNEDLADKNRIEGEARFFRALNYYNLQNYFGGVPVVVSSDDNRVAIPKSSREEVKTLIESDLVAAAALLPDVVESKANALYSRPSKQAAYGLLARLYINWDGRADRWEKTSWACSQVISNPSDLGLELDYPKIFSLSSEKNKEIVYAIEHNTFTPPSGSFLLNNYTYSPFEGSDAMKSPIGANIGFGGNWQVKRSTLFIHFDNNDVRKKQILSSYIRKDGRNKNLFGEDLLVNKYPLDPINLINPFGGNDQPIIRYADIILMKAEAENHLGNLGEAIALVNQIRTRAGLGPLTPPHTNSLASLNDYIYYERRREFFFEGLGRTDMIRFKLSTNNTHDNEFLKVVANKPRIVPLTGDIKRFLLFPFDGLALRNNPALIQNEGYQ